MPLITLISACLLGVRCRWDGGNHTTQFTPTEGILYIPVCPEQLGGMATPRPACHIIQGGGEDVLAGQAVVVELKSGKECTEYFLRGARETLLIAQQTGARRAILKQRSPSCGYGEIYHGSAVVKGNGVTAALLIAAGIEVESR